MGLLSFLGAGSAGDVANAATKAVDSLGKAGDALFTSDEERAQWATVMEQVKQQPKMAQALITFASTQSTSTFVAGARSAVLYVLAVVLGYNLVLRDILIMCLHLKPEEVPAMAIGVDTLLKFIGALSGAM